MPMSNLIIIYTHGILFYISEASRLCGNKGTASSPVSAGSSLLGGSTAMLLTLLGGCCMLVSSCDLENSRIKPVSFAGTPLHSLLIRALLALCVKDYYVEQISTGTDLNSCTTKILFCFFSSLSKLSFFFSSEACYEVGKTK